MRTKLCFFFLLFFCKRNKKKKTVEIFNSHSHFAESKKERKIKSKECKHKQNYTWKIVTQHPLFRFNFFPSSSSSFWFKRIKLVDKVSILDVWNKCVVLTKILHEWRKEFVRVCVFSGKKCLYSFSSVFLFFTNDTFCYLMWIVNIKVRVSIYTLIPIILYPLFTRVK